MPHVKLSLTKVFVSCSISPAHRWLVFQNFGKNQNQNKIKDIQYKAEFIMKCIHFEKQILSVWLPMLPSLPLQLSLVLSYLFVEWQQGVSMGW